jgi:hypothetical protein
MGHRMSKVVDVIALSTMVVASNCYSPAPSQPDASMDASDASTDSRTSDAIIDSDSDGVIDRLDNCPTVANNDQNDEDGDTRGDVCDGCPIDAASADGDADGVEGACDPSDARRDHIALFDSFSAPILNPRWVVAGDWTTGTGTAVYTTSTTRGLLTTMLPVDNHKTLMIADFIPNDLNAQGGSFALVNNFNGSTGERCGFSKFSGGLTGTFNGAGSSVTDAKPLLADVTHTYRMRWELNPLVDAGPCTITDINKGTSVTLQGIARPTSQIGLRFAAGATAKFILVVVAN